jgi:hypothetical protein
MKSKTNSNKVVIIFLGVVITLIAFIASVGLKYQRQQDEMQSSIYETLLARSEKGLTNSTTIDDMKTENLNINYIYLSTVEANRPEFQKAAEFFSRQGNISLQNKSLAILNKLDEAKAKLDKVKAYQKEDGTRAKIDRDIELMNANVVRMNREEAQEKEELAKELTRRSRGDMMVDTETYTNMRVYCNQKPEEAGCESVEKIR